MSPRCYFLRRKFLLSLENRIPSAEAKRLESHFARCRPCRDLYAKIQAGDRIGREFARLGPDLDPPPPEFEAVRAKIIPNPEAADRAVRFRMNPLRALATPLGAGILVVLVLIQATLLVLSNRKMIFPGKDPGLSAGARLYAGFHPLHIPDFPSNTKTDVFTEGFVRDVYYDEEEKTIHLKLVEMDQTSEPFVICEIRRPGGMTIPRKGARVRVYGTARFDAQPGREWHEVNPVLEVAVLKR
jgi:hypothetical protein